MTNSLSKARINYQYYLSPCGKLMLASLGNELCLCDWSEQPCALRNKRRLVRLLNAEFHEASSVVIRLAAAQLDEYFAGRRTLFSVPLRFVGTDFQLRVWHTLLETPYGEMRTYRDIARLVGNEKGVRAVAQAIGANGLSIVCPCHRIIGSDGSLTGYAGGLEAKRLLIELERRKWGL